MADEVEISGQRAIGEQASEVAPVGATILPIVPPAPSHTVTAVGGMFVLIFVRAPHSRTITLDHEPSEAEIAEHEAHAIEAFASMDQPILQDRRRPKQ